ncbi:hypothetical protein ATE92_1255 [Ulvibacter sp. MAR_2010_11]|nr:hypothetical protein ATE92_1255 [Ulvibacter sp. MAR_2010_11]
MISFFRTLRLRLLSEYPCERFPYDIRPDSYWAMASTFSKYFRYPTTENVPVLVWIFIALRSNHLNENTKTEDLLTLKLIK